MLQAIGIRSVDELFSPIPAEYRVTRDLAVPRQMAESEIVDWFKQRGKENGEGYTSFLGAGAYSHYRPVVIDALVQRGEFLTSYTPYQAEFAQGTLQAIFEFQTMISELTGMDLANASMYDGSTAAAEAVMMAVRVTGRRSAVIARNLHPEYREVLHTYATHQEIPQKLVSFTTALQTLEDSGEILLAIKADANRNIDLGVQHGFFLEPLHHAIGNQFVVFGGAQLRAHRLECHQETLEVGVVVERLNLGKSGVVAVQLAEFKERGRLDRALQVQVQLRLRQLTDKSIGRAQRHGSHPVDCRFLTKDLRGNGDLAGEDFSATIGYFSDHGLEIS